MANLLKTLNTLGIPDVAARVYLHLLETGASSARQLASQVGIPRPSVYDNLKLLIACRLVVEREEEGKKIFQADDVRQLPELVRAKIEELKREERAIQAILPTLGSSARALEPKIRFYSGTQGVKQVLTEVFWQQDIETLCLWPISEMIALLGVDYMADINRRRIRQQISIRGIWPRDKAVSLKDYPFMGVGEGFYREIRLAPPSMSWAMSSWVYNDKVAFISSRQEGFGFVVHSQDFTDLLRTQFEEIWKRSRPIKPQPQYTDAFLQTI